MDLVLQEEVLAVVLLVQIASHGQRLMGQVVRHFVLDLAYAHLIALQNATWTGYGSSQGCIAAATDWVMSCLVLAD